MTDALTPPLEPPQPTWSDHAHTAVSAVADALVPGGAAILGWLINPPLERRRDAFLAELSKRVDTLEKRGVDVKALASNEEFIDVVIRGGQAWMRTSREEKRQAILNAITNVGLGWTAASNVTVILLRFIDELDPVHFRMLEFLKDGPVWYQTHGIPFPTDMSSMLPWITTALPEYKNDVTLLETVWSELQARWLVPRKELDLYGPRTHVPITGYSRWLLDLVRKPPEAPHSAST